MLLRRLTMGQICTIVTSSFRSKASPCSIYLHMVGLMSIKSSSQHVNLIFLLHSQRSTFQVYKYQVFIIEIQFYIAPEPRITVKISKSCVCGWSFAPDPTYWLALPLCLDPTGGSAPRLTYRLALNALAIRVFRHTNLNLLPAPLFPDRALASWLAVAYLRGAQGASAPPKRINCPKKLLW
jgi:hypothetical protein